MGVRVRDRKYHVGARHQQIIGSAANIDIAVPRPHVIALYSAMSSNRARQEIALGRSHDIIDAVPYPMRSQKKPKYHSSGDRAAPRYSISLSHEVQLSNPLSSNVESPLAPFERGEIKVPLSKGDLGGFRCTSLA